MASSISQIAALRRLARVYRRILVLAVPAALAGCQDGDDALAPDPTGAPSEVSSPVAEVVPSDALASLTATGRIVFSAFGAEEEADVWTMGPVGGNMTHLTSFAGAELDPVWSPDHKQIAFQRARNGKLDIYLMNADGTNKHWALPTAPLYPLSTPSWSPDGKSLLVQVWLGSPTKKPYVGKIDLVSKMWTLVMQNHFVAVPGWYPTYDNEGKWIYYVEAASRDTVRRFQPNGATYMVVGFRSPSVDDLAWSPDGTKLAFSLLYGLENREIGVWNLSTHQFTRLTNNSASDNHPAWSPDGTLIAFASNRSGKFQIHTMNSSTGGNLHKITSKTNGAGYPSW